MKTKQTYFVTGEELKEKRTKFLQARCAESQYFGMRKVSEWLQEQLHLERPTDIEVWTQIILRNANMVGSDVGKESLPKLLRNHGLRLSEVNLFKEEHPSIGIHTLLDNVFGDLAEAYITDSGLIYLSLDSTEVIRFEGHERRGTFDTHVLISDVLESARLSWRFSNQRYHTMSARNFLCSWLERRIQYVIDKAGEEFDSAVAVSVDNTKIVTADRVVLSRYNRTLQLYGNLFVENKIVQHSNFIRDNDPIHLGSTVTRESIFPAFMGRFNMYVLEHWQQYFTAVIMPDGVVEKWLWCHIGEDDLPEGGIPLNL